MTTECITAEKKDIRRQNYRADSDAEGSNIRRRVGEPKRTPDIVNEKEYKNQREIKKIAMNILQNKRKFSLAAIAMARFADGTRRRVCPKRFIIRAAIVITGKSKTGWRPENQKRGRKGQPIGNPGRFSPEQTLSSA